MIRQRRLAIAVVAVAVAVAVCFAACRETMLTGKEDDTDAGYPGEWCPIGMTCGVDAAALAFGCGSLASTCCGNICQTGLTCVGGADGGAGTCQTCGASGQPCCAGGGFFGAGTCSAGLGCVTSGGSSSCQVCGDAGQPCCGGAASSGGTCNTGYTCVGGSSNICAACGDAGQPCCGNTLFDRTCNTGFTCQLDGGRLGTTPSCQ